MRDGRTDGVSKTNIPPPTLLRRGIISTFYELNNHTQTKPSAVCSLHVNSWVNAGHFGEKSQHYNGINCGPMLAIVFLCRPKPLCRCVFMKAVYEHISHKKENKFHRLNAIISSTLQNCNQQKYRDSGKIAIAIAVKSNRLIISLTYPNQIYWLKNKTRPLVLLDNGIFN